MLVLLPICKRMELEKKLVFFVFQFYIQLIKPDPKFTGFLLQSILGNIYKTLNCKIKINLNNTLRSLTSATHHQCKDYKIYCITIYNENKF